MKQKHTHDGTQVHRHNSTLCRPPTQTEHQVQSGLLLDVVISQSAAILQLLAGENQTLLIRRNAVEEKATVSELIHM